MKKRCVTCRFSNFESTPHCRRFPPTATTPLTCAFPVVSEDGTWCHEHNFSLQKWLKFKFKRKQEVSL